MSASSPGTCENCGAVLHGRYCAVCGQDREDRAAPLRVLLARGLGDLLALDLRYPRTVRALLSPGRLSVLYLGGQRVPFVPPFRLALSTGILLFVVVALRLPVAASVTVSGGLAEDLSVVAREYASALVGAQLLMLPAVAGVLWFAFREQRSLFAEHMVVALYYHSAVALCVLTLFLLSFGLPTAVVGWVGLVWLGGMVGPYLYLVIRRVYGGGARSVAGWVLAASAYLLLNAIAFGVVVVLAA